MDMMITSFAVTNDLIEATKAINEFHQAFAPYQKSLTNKVRASIRNVGTSRYGMVKIVDNIATQHDAKLSKEDNAIELTSRINYLDLLRKYKVAVMSLLEALDDTDKALGKDIMAYADKFSEHLKTARQHDGDLDEAMKELDEYNARFGAVMEEEGKTPEKPATEDPLIPTT